MENFVSLEFKEFSLTAAIFENKIGDSFLKNAPYELSLISWGNEVYGSIGIDLGVESPQPTIKEGGLAYTNQGNYLCIFFGQTPAWPVEYIGQITGDEWKRLLDANTNLTQVKITLVNK